MNRTIIDQSKSNGAIQHRVCCFVLLLTIISTYTQQTQEHLKTPFGMCIAPVVTTQSRFFGETGRGGCSSPIQRKSTHLMLMQYKVRDVIRGKRHNGVIGMIALPLEVSLGWGGGIEGGGEDPNERVRWLIILFCLPLNITNYQLGEIRLCKYPVMFLY